MKRGLCAGNLLPYTSYFLLVSLRGRSWFLLVLIHLMVGEVEAVEGEHAGDAVADGELRRDIEPAGRSRFVHARVQRPLRHVEERLARQVGAVLRRACVLICT